MPNKLIVRLVFLNVVFLNCGSVHAKSPISLDVLRRDGYGSVQLVKSGANRLMVPAEINGKRLSLLLDTGFGTPGIAVSLNPAALHITPEKGVGLGQSVSGAVTKVGHGTAQSVVMGNVQIKGAPIFFGSFGTAGYVGRGFLRTNSAIIDLTNLRLYLRPPGKGRRVDLASALKSVGMAEVPFGEMVRGDFLINVEVNGIPAKMVLDTGAQVTVLDTRFAKQASAAAWGRTNIRGVDAVGRVVPADFAGTKSFRIGGVPIKTPVVEITNFPVYSSSGGKIVGLLGLDLLGMNWGIIDFGQQKLYFAQAR
jgi:predicted aspartyl protease